VSAKEVTWTRDRTGAGPRGMAFDMIIHLQYAISEFKLWFVDSYVVLRHSYVVLSGL
jgi:hypothetical protein